jgi:hypothetical protein
MRRTLLAIGAAAALAAAALPTSANAQHYNWGGGPHFRGPGISFDFGVAPSYGYVAPSYGYYDYGYGDCYQLRHMRTPFGWRTQRVWVC